MMHHRIAGHIGIRRLAALVGASLALSAVAVSGAGLVTPTTASAAIGPVGEKVFGGHPVESPVAVSGDGSHTWVANSGDNSVTELDSATGNVIQKLMNGPYDFSNPSAIADVGGVVWVTNTGNSTVTEIDGATGNLIQVISTGAGNFAQPDAVASDGNFVWVANSGNNTVTVLNASNAALATILGGGFGFNHPKAIAIGFPYVYVANELGNSVTVIDEGSNAMFTFITGGGINSPEAIAADGSQVYVANSPSSTISVFSPTGTFAYGISALLSNPQGLVSDGTNLWVANFSSGTVTEYVDAFGGLENVFSGSPWNFAEPAAIASDGSDLWVANFQNNSVTQMDAGGGFLSVVQGPSYAFGAAAAVSADATHVWVADASTNAVTELNKSDGSLVQVLSGGSYNFSDPTGISSDGTHVWVANGGNNSVTELNASDGSFVANLSAPSYQFSGPTAVASDGTHVFVGNGTGNTMTVISCATPSVFTVDSGVSFAFSDPVAVAVDGVHVWVANATGASVTELNESDGSLVQVLSGGTYQFSAPASVGSDGTHVWVGNSGSNSVTELSAASGSFADYLSGSPFSFSSPTSITTDGIHTWVANESNSSVTELDSTTDAFVQVLSSAQFGFNQPDAILATDPTHVWVTNNNVSSLDELFPPASAPTAPTGVSGVPGNGAVDVSWSAPRSDGGAAITSYTAMASPGGASCTTPDGSTLSCNVTGLSNGTAYTFTVTATNAAGTSVASAPSASVTPATVPDPPPFVGAENTGFGISVFWPAPSNDGGSPITEYTATASPGGVTCTTTSTGCHFLPGLTAGQSYTFSVTATNAVGTSGPSSDSNPVTLTTAPSQPTGVVAVAGNQSATVSWTAPTFDGGQSINNFTVTADQDSSKQCTTPDGSTLHCTVTGLTNGTSYTFSVVASNGTGTSDPSASSAAVTPATVPNAPTAAHTTSAAGAVTVGWTAPAFNGGAPILGFKVTASPGGASCSTTAKSCVVSGLKMTTAYTFTVTARNAIGTSAPSTATQSTYPVNSTSFNVRPLVPVSLGKSRVGVLVAGVASGKVVTVHIGTASGHCTTGATKQCVALVTAPGTSGLQAVTASYKASGTTKTVTSASKLYVAHLTMPSTFTVGTNAVFKITHALPKSVFSLTFGGFTVSTILDKTGGGNLGITPATGGTFALIVSDGVTQLLRQSIVVH